MSTSQFRPSPAMVVALIALFLALGGIGYAAATIDTNDIKKGAVTKNKLHKNAVTSKKVKNNSLTGKDIDESTLSVNKDILFATVAPAGLNPEIVRGRGATAVTRVTNGSFRVTFNRNITGCTWLATYGQPGDQFVDALWATVRGRDTNTDVGVVLRDAAGNQVDGAAGFHVEVLCP